MKQRATIWGSARTRWAAALGIFLLAAAGPAGASGYEESEAGPAGTLRTARPTLSWKIAPTGDTQITEATLTLNGTPVPVRYSPAEGAVAYTPAEPLPPGAYAVKCTVMLDGEWPVSKEWRFTIAAGARREPPAPSSAQSAAWTAANVYRRRLALPEFRLDPRLCAAAAEHSAYLQQSGVLAHEQQPDRPGFTAAGAAERRAMWGYADGAFQNIASGDASITEAVRSLFDAPYHRIAFLQPGTPHFGAGHAGGKTTLEMGATQGTGTVVYPADGQRDVPTRWSGNEIPNPLAPHKAAYNGGPVGYVLTFFHFSPNDSRLHSVRATLTTENGTPVPFFLNTPQNDAHLKNGVFLIPKQPLKPGATYHVSVSAQTAEGLKVSRSWGFTAATSAPASLRLAQN